MSENVETVIRFRADTSDFFREINRIRTSVDDIRSIKEKTLATTREDITEQIKGTKGVFQRFKQIRSVNSEIQKSLNANRENVDILKEQRDITLENFRLVKAQVDSNVAKKAELESNVNDQLKERDRLLKVINSTQKELNSQLELQQMHLDDQEYYNDVIKESKENILKINKKIVDLELKASDKTIAQKKLELMRDEADQVKEAYGEISALQRGITSAELEYNKVLKANSAAIKDYTLDNSKLGKEVARIYAQMANHERRRQTAIERGGTGEVHQQRIDELKERTNFEKLEAQRIQNLKFASDVAKSEFNKIEKANEGIIAKLLNKYDVTIEQVADYPNLLKDISEQTKYAMKITAESTKAEKARNKLLEKRKKITEELSKAEHEFAMMNFQNMDMYTDENGLIEQNKQRLYELKLSYSEIDEKLHQSTDQLTRFASATLQSVNELKEIRKTLASFGIDLTEVNHNIDNLTKSFISMRDNLDFFRRGRLFVEQLKHGVGELKDKLVDMGKYLGDKANKYDYFNYRENKKNLQALQRDMAQQVNLLRDNEKEILAAQKLQESVMINKAGRAQVRGGATVELPDGSIAKGGDLLPSSFKNIQKDTEKIIRTKEMENKAIISGLKDQKDEQNRLQGEIKDTRLAYAAMAAAAVGALNYIKNATPELGAQTKIINHEFRMMAREIGRELVPMFKEFAKVAKAMRQWFKEQPAFVKKSIAVFFMLVTVMLLVGSGVAALSFAFGGLATAFGIVAGGATALGAAFVALATGTELAAGVKGARMLKFLKIVLKLLKPVIFAFKILIGILKFMVAPFLFVIKVFAAAATGAFGLAAGIAIVVGIVAAFIAIAVFLPNIVDGFSKAIEKNEKKGTKWGKFLANTLKVLRMMAIPFLIIGGLLRGLWFGFKALFDGDKSTKFGDGFAEGFAPVIEVLKVAWENLKEWGTNIANWAKGIWNNVKEFFTDKFGDWFNHTSLRGILETAIGYFTNFGTDVKTKISEAWTNIKDAVTGWDLAGTISGAIDDFLAAFEIGDSLETKIEDLKTKISDKIEEIKDFFIGEEGLKDKIVGAFEGMFENLKIGEMLGELGSKILTFLADKGIVNKINDMIDTTVDNISGVLRTEAMQIALLGQHEDIISKYIEPIRNFKIDLPELATGTLEVPEDMNARIHKGEMIVPATFAEGIRNIMNGTGGSVGSTVNLTFNVQVVEAGNADLVAKKVTDQVMDEINRQVNWQ